MARRKGGDLERAWRRAATLAPEHALALPFARERVVAVGSGASLAIARAYAALREDGGHGPTDAFPPDELPRRAWDRSVLLSRRGDEPALVDALHRLRADAVLAIAIGAPAGSPVDELAGVTVPLEPAPGPGDEEAAYATTAFAVLRAHLAGDTDEGTGGGAAASALAGALPDVGGVRRWVLLGRRWSLGLAEEAARSLRAAGADATAGPASELFAGALGDPDEGTLVWSFAAPDDAVRGWADGRGAALRAPSLDPVGELVLALRIADRLAGRAP
jgi:fructoselysine-6-P-deglycase FrlB-like protein